MALYYDSPSSIAPVYSMRFTPEESADSLSGIDATG
jgi:hypothetical protein